MTVMYFKIRQKRQQGFLTGFAASIEIDDGRVLLRDRRVPLASLKDGRIFETAQLLGDLELAADAEKGWAAWGYPVDAPSWWGTAPVGAEEPDDVLVSNEEAVA